MASRKSVKQQAFLAAYAKTGNVTAAARQAKCHRASHYDWLSDPDYADAFQQAQEQAVEDLESEARKRAKHGSDLRSNSVDPLIFRERHNGFNAIKSFPPIRVWGTVASLRQWGRPISRGWTSSVTTHIDIL